MAWRGSTFPPPAHPPPPAHAGRLTEGTEPALKGPSHRGRSAPYQTEALLLEALEGLDCSKQQQK